MSETLSKQEIALKHFRGEVIDNNPNEGNDVAAAKAEEERLAKEAADAEALRIKEEEEKNKPAQSTELSDDELLELMSKKTGRKFSSFDEFKPKAEEVDKEKAAEERESDKISYGLKKGLFNKNQLEGYFADSKNKIGVVYNSELAQAKKEDPEWDEEKEKEFKAEFEAEYGIDQDDSSLKRKRGQRKLDIYADQILKNTYSSIFSLEDQYSKHESETKARTEREQKILNAAPIYAKDLNEVATSLSKIEIPFGENEKYEVPVSAEILKEVKDLLSDKDFVSSQIEKGYSKEELAQTAKNIIISKNLPALVKAVADQYKMKHEKGVRGIPAGGALEKDDDGLGGLTDNQKQALTFFKSEKPAIAN